MKQYEITYLTQEDLKEKPVAKEIEELGGKIISALPLGQKQLVYKIKKAKEAYFTTVIFDIEGEKVVDLNRKLDLKDEILRHLIVILKLPKEILPKAPKAVKEKTVEIETPKVELPEEKIEEKAAETPKPTKAVKAEKETKESKIEEKERLKALDKKLDELLKE